MGSDCSEPSLCKPQVEPGKVGDSIVLIFLLNSTLFQPIPAKVGDFAKPWIEWA